MVKRMTKQMSTKKWTYMFLAICGSLLLLCAAVTVAVDPYFHYHKPLAGLSYELNNERYMNDGITRHFDYDAIITGTSMTHNFKTTEFDTLFDAKSIKVPYSGAGYQELSQSMERALKRNPDISQVLWAIDYSNLTEPIDWARYENYPAYLYDDNYLNDAPYLFNKSVLYHGVANNVMRTLHGEPNTTFDEYKSFQDPVGDEGVVNHTMVEKVAVEQRHATPEEIQAVEETVSANITALVNQYPNTKFYLFIPPHHISYWYFQAEKGLINVMADAEQRAAELLLECPNVELYCFFNDKALVCNGDNYGDSLHYSAAVNSEILQWIHDGTGRITKDNYIEHVEETRSFYLDYLTENNK